MKYIQLVARECLGDIWSFVALEDNCRQHDTRFCSPEETRVCLSKYCMLGTEHMLALASVHNLGNLYVGQGKLAEAEHLYMRALRVDDRGILPPCSNSCRL